MKHTLKTTIGAIAAVAVFALSLPVFASSLPVGVSQFYLAGAGTTATATSIQLTSMLTPDGRPVTMSMFGTTGYAAIDPQTNSKIEDISFTGIVQNANGTATLTGITRGMDFVYPYAGTPSLGKTHSGGATLIITNTAGFYYNEFAMPGNSNVTIYPTASTSVATKGYVDSVAFGNVPQASTIAAGIVQLGTGIQIASSTVTGSAGPLVIPGNLATSTYNAATAPLRVVVTQNSGKIDPYFIATSSLGLPSPVNIQTFTATTASSTWIKPTGAASVEIILIAGGASGGAGGPSGSGGLGGAGGGGGGVLIKSLPASILGSTESVGIGVGGAPVSSAGSNGNDGGITNFGTWAKSYGGSGGGSGGVGVGIGCINSLGTGASTGGACGGAPGTIGNTGGVGGAGYIYGAAGGGAGGSGSGGDGGKGGAQLSKGTPAGGNGGVAAGNVLGNPGSAPSNVPALEPTAGAGGGGGGGVAGGSATGGTGGHGGLYGGGGGGGGGVSSGGGTGGTSGAGADGFAMIITYF